MPLFLFYTSTNRNQFGFKNNLLKQYFQGTTTWRGSWKIIYGSLPRMEKLFVKKIYGNSFLLYSQRKNGGLLTYSGHVNDNIHRRIFSVEIIQKLRVENFILRFYVSWIDTECDGEFSEHQFWMENFAFLEVMKRTVAKFGSCYSVHEYV